MLQAKRDTDPPPTPVKLDGLTDEAPRRGLSSLMVWAGVAMFLVGAAVLGARTETGSQRIAKLLAPTPPPVQLARAEPPRPASPDTLLLYETRRLADQVRVLNAEREALADRLANVERSVGDVTASIPRTEATRAEPPRVEPARPDPVRRSAPCASSPLRRRLLNRQPLRAPLRRRHPCRPPPRPLARPPRPRLTRLRRRPRDRKHRIRRRSARSSASIWRVSNPSRPCAAAGSSCAPSTARFWKAFVPSSPSRKARGRGLRSSCGWWRVPCPMPMPPPGFAPRCPSQD